MTTDQSHEPTVWVLADDRAGNVAQALGVAEALGWPFFTKTVTYSSWANLPNQLLGASLLGVTPSTRLGLLGHGTGASPRAVAWPDVVIAAGRRTAPVARWIRRQSGGKALLCQVMWPGSSGAADFDVIAVPQHDHPHHSSGERDNILSIVGAPHRVTAARLSSEAARWAPRLADIPSPRLALVVGGSTKHHTFTVDMAKRLAEQVAPLVEASAGSLMVTTSRRTGARATEALLANLPRVAHAFRWTADAAAGDNPYFGYLALADYIIVTGDSVSMVSEACAGQAPVMVFAPDDLIGKKHRRFLSHLFASGMAQPLTESLPPLAPRDGLNAAQDIAAALRHCFARRAEA